MTRTRTKAAGAAAVAFTLVTLPVVLLGGAGSPPSSCPPVPAPASASGGDWEATAYGPPWGGIQGSGITATGINLSAGQPALEIAVDPSVISLGSFEHITPNPFGTKQAFYAGDTGGAIIGNHVDIYDWQGRSAQDAWGQRHVTVTAAPNPGTGNLLGEITPTANTTATTPASSSAAASCSSSTAASGPLPVTNGPAATILANGQAAAPKDAPRAVQLAIAAGNQIIDTPYIWGGGHAQSLDQIAAGYDCSGSTSYMLHAAGLLGPSALVSGDFETWQLPGAGQWITVYANSAHVFIDVAGVVMDTAHYSATTPAGSGPRWQPASMIDAQISGDIADGYGGFVQRHPKGL